MRTALLLAFVGVAGAASAFDVILLAPRPKAGVAVPAPPEPPGTPSYIIVGAADDFLVTEGGEKVQE